MKNMAIIICFVFFIGILGVLHREIRLLGDNNKALYVQIETMKSDIETLKAYENENARKPKTFLR